MTTTPLPDITIAFSFARNNVAAPTRSAQRPRSTVIFKRPEHSKPNPSYGPTPDVPAPTASRAAVQDRDRSWERTSIRFNFLHPCEHAGMSSSLYQVTNGSECFQSSRIAHQEQIRTGEILSIKILSGIPPAKQEPAEFLVGQ